LFVKYIKLCMGMEWERWFVGLCNLSKVDTRLFDTVCQTMLSYIYTYFENMRAKADKNMESSFHFQVFQFQTSKDFTKVINGMPHGMDDQLQIVWF
jgi:hypothetical protein